MNPVLSTVCFPVLSTVCFPVLSTVCFPVLSAVYEPCIKYSILPSLLLCRLSFVHYSIVPWCTSSLQGLSWAYRVLCRTYRVIVTLVCLGPRCPSLYPTPCPLPSSLPSIQILESSIQFLSVILEYWSPVSMLLESSVQLPESSIQYP